MGESELEWMAVTSGGMNVCHSTFFCFFGVATETGQLFSDSLCCTSHMLLMKDFQLASEATKPGGKTVALVVLGSYHPVTSGAWVEEDNYCPQVLPFMWRAHLPLACRLQGWHRVVCANLAGKD